jgi:hypothetical protein
VTPGPVRGTDRAGGDAEEVVLHGGIANAGAVVRVGPHVLRPANPFTPTIHRFLSRLHDAGFDGASVPVGVDGDGRERLIFIEGEVPIPPFPAWAQREESLASIVELLQRFHRASSRMGCGGGPWCRDMADPAVPPGSDRPDAVIVCHNDVCFENVVFRHGRAVGLLDFDFAAPGRPVYDLAQCARLCVPIDDDLSVAGLGFDPVDRPARLRLVADVYGLDEAGRRVFLDVIDDAVGRGGEFFLRRIEVGDTNLTALWHAMGGMARFDRRRKWWSGARTGFAAALGA